MPSESAADRRATVLADWQEAINDQSALLGDPALRVGELTHQSHARGVIDAEDLRELLEWADAALPRLKSTADIESRPFGLAARAPDSLSLH